MKLIDNWRQCHRFWSVRLQLAGAAILTFVEGFPDAFVSVWSVIPADVRAEIPSDLVRWVGIAVVAVGIIARIVRQDRLHEPPDPGLGGEGQRGIPRDAV
ncbi:hypothetical protein ABRY95_13725 [Castellaniella ginsengisoli]|uniref:Holin n=1 Tax=Castellaniella ginsengisoli TaxID=546114 RepID=A0AB39GWX4_9BURK